MADASTKVTTSTQITHIGSGASIAPGGFSGSADISTALARTGNLGAYPAVDIAVKVQGTASIASASQNLYLYRRDINIDGTNDETVPGTSNRQHHMVSKVVPAGTAASWTHYISFTNVPVPAHGDCEFYLESGLGVNITPGWSMKVTPRTNYGATT